MGGEQPEGPRQLSNEWHTHTRIDLRVCIEVLNGRGKVRHKADTLEEAYLVSEIK